MTQPSLLNILTASSPPCCCVLCLVCPWSLWTEQEGEPEAWKMFLSCCPTLPIGEGTSDQPLPHPLYHVYEFRVDSRTHFGDVPSAQTDRGVWGQQAAQRGLCCLHQGCSPFCIVPMTVTLMHSDYDDDPGSDSQ